MFLYSPSIYSKISRLIHLCIKIKNRSATNTGWPNEKLTWGCLGYNGPDVKNVETRRF